MRLAVVGLLCALASPLLAFAETPAEILQKARESHRNRDFDKALAYYEDALKQEPPSDSLKEFVAKYRSFVEFLKAGEGLSGLPPAKPGKSLGLSLAWGLFPGGGHFYLKRPLKGALYAGATGGLFAASLAVRHRGERHYNQYLVETGAPALENEFRLYSNDRERANFLLAGAIASYLFSLNDVQFEYRLFRLRWEWETWGGPGLSVGAGF